MMAWLIAFGCLVVAIVTALSFMRDWRLALASHFRPHLASASLLLVLLVSVVALPGWVASLAALLALLAAAANLFAIWRVIPHIASPATGAGGDHGLRLRIAFANVLRQNMRHVDVLGWVRRENVDVFVACEVEGVWPEAIAELADILPYGTQSPYGDLVILSRRPLKDVRHPVTRYGNAVTAELNTEAGKLTLVALHAAVPRNGRDSTGRDAMIETVGHIVWRREGGVVVVGDFNATPWSIPMRRLLAGGRLAYGPGAFRGTFPSWLPDWAGIPIDLVLAGGGWRVAGQRRGPRVGSDHYPVLAEVTAVKR